MIAARSSASTERQAGRRRPYNSDVSHEQHKATAPTHVRCFVLTVSDTRTELTDSSGNAIVDALTRAGHQVVGRAIVKDDPAEVTRLVMAQVADPRDSGDHHDRWHWTYFA